MSNVQFSKKTDPETVRRCFLPYIKSLDITRESRVVIKTHFGEQENTRYIKPQLILPIVEELKKIGCEVFISDCNTLYKGKRVRGSVHKKLAEEHGFGILRIPIIIGDGENGKDEYSVPISKNHFKNVWLGKSYEDREVVILINHFKGHIMAGFGGAIKNAGMGMASRRGKMAMHASVIPEVSRKNCVFCGTCREHCDHDAINIDLKKKTIEIDPDKCVGCAMCISVCPHGAMNIPWSSSTCDQLVERAAEYAYGALLGKKVFAINFMIDITKLCDCRPDTEIISEDVGVACSDDVVALDAACYEMVKKKNKGEDIFTQSSTIDSIHNIDYSVKISLGESTFTIKEI